MRGNDIPTRCATDPDRTRILVNIKRGSDDLLSVVDEAGRFDQGPPEGPVASFPASYGCGGEDVG